MSDEKFNFSYEHKIINGGTMLSIAVVIPGQAVRVNARTILERIRPAPGFRKPKKLTSELMEASRRDLVQRCSDNAISRSLAFHNADDNKQAESSVIDLVVKEDGSLSYTILVSVVPLQSSVEEPAVNVQVESASITQPAG